MRHRGGAQGTGRAERAAAHTPYLSLIDGVRGVAAIVVLFYHYVHFFMAGPDRAPLRGAIWMFPGADWLWPLYAYGYYAVQVFWLISGLVFAQVYYGGKADTRSFVVNRIARLYPLHLLTLLVVTALDFIALHRLGYIPIYSHFDLPHFTEQVFMASDWLREDGTYSFNGPIWSVSVEIVVYALFWLSRRWVARLGLPLALALAFCGYLAHYQWGGYTRVFECCFYFFIGCALNLVLRGAWGKGVRLAALVLPMAGIGFYALIVGHNDWWWRYYAIPGLCGALFLLLVKAEPRAPQWLRRASEWLGENTYGIYLWHVPVQLVLILLLLPAHDLPALAKNWWFFMGFVALVLVAARISYVWFERPARDAVRARLGATGGAAKRG